MGAEQKVMERENCGDGGWEQGCFVCVFGA